VNDFFRYDCRPTPRNHGKNPGRRPQRSEAATTGGRGVGVPACEGAKVEPASLPVQLHSGRALEHPFKRAGSSLGARSAGCLHLLSGAGRMPALPLSPIRVETTTGQAPDRRPILIATKYLLLFRGQDTSPDPAWAGSAFTPTDVGAVCAFFTGCEKCRLAGFENPDCRVEFPDEGIGGFCR